MPFLLALCHFDLRFAFLTHVLPFLLAFCHFNAFCRFNELCRFNASRNGKKRVETAKRKNGKTRVERQNASRNGKMRVETAERELKRQNAS